MYSQYKKYAEDVVNGKVLACKAIQLACQRYLDWFNRNDIEFRPDRCDRVINFTSKLKHYQGKSAGQYFQMTDCQKWMVYNIFGWYWKGTNLRVTNKVLIMVSRKFGKALDIETDIPTPTGWKKMKDIHPGDYVFGQDGRPTKVLEESHIQYNECYKVTFENGAEVIADAHHNWSVKRRSCNYPDYMEIRTTKEMYDYGVFHARRDGNKEYNWRTLMTKPVEYTEKELPIDPYILGLWLGDGSKRAPEFATQKKYDDYKIYDYLVPFYGEYRIYQDKRKSNNISVIFSRDHKPSKLYKDLKSLNLICNKHIPDIYLEGSVEQRLALLQGLMDTDGCVSNGKYPVCEFVNKNEDIANKVCQLLSSLGIKYHITDKYIMLNGKKCGPYKRINFYTDKTKPCFKMQRKYDRLPEKLNKRMMYNSIIDIQPCETVPCKCISVDNEDKLYLFGRNYTVTHNSFFAAALCLYCLIGDDEAAAQILNVASNKEQAKLLFKMEQVLCKQLDPKHKFLKVLRDRITFDQTNSYAQVLASDKDGLDGASPYMFVCDETHTYKTSELWDGLISGTGFRENPLCVQISTAGFNLTGFLKEYYDTCKDILLGLKEDDTQFSAIYELDEEDDWQDEKVWIKANPNLGETVTMKYLREQVKSAKNTPSLETSVKTKNFNMWCQSKDVWIPDVYITKEMKPINIKDFKDEDSFMGVDLSAVSDMTCTSVLFPPNKERKLYPDKYVFKNYIYLPESCLVESKNSELYKAWTKQNFLILTSGNVVDYDHILKDQINIYNNTYLINVAYDSWNATQWAINATDEGLPLVPYSQATGNFNKPTKLLEMLIRQDKVVIDYNPITRWSFGNVSLKIDTNENQKPTKANGERNKKIDPVIAMIQALGGYLDKHNYTDGEVLTV